MGVCSSVLQSADSQDEKQQSAVIDKHLDENGRRLKNECKILLLGASLQRTQLTTGSGESGKSTIVKQMKIIHQNGYSREELLVYRLTVIRNLVDSAQAVVLALRKLMLEAQLPQNRVRHARPAPLTTGKHGCNFALPGGRRRKRDAAGTYWRCYPVAMAGSRHPVADGVVE